MTSNCGFYFFMIVIVGSRQIVLDLVGSLCCFYENWKRDLNLNLIVCIFKSGDKNNPSNYKISMINLLLTKLYEIVLESKNNLHVRWAKGQVGFKECGPLNYFRVDENECWYNKSDPIYCFIHI